MIILSSLFIDRCNIDKYYDDLIYALQEDIARAEDEINQLQREIHVTKDKDVKTNLRLDVARLKAELRALQNSYHEFIVSFERQEVSSKIERNSPLLPRLEDDEIVITDYFPDKPHLEVDNKAVLRAKALLQSRSRRPIEVLRDNAHGHSVTKRLNRDLVVCSVTVKQLCIQYHGLNEFNLSEDCIALSVFFNSFEFAIHHRVFDTRMSLFLSSFEIFDEVAYTNDYYRGKILLFSGEGMSPAIPSLNTALYELQQDNNKR